MPARVAKPDVSKSRRSDVSSSRRWSLLDSPAPWLGGAAIFAAVFLAYLPAINGGFILDDDLLLTNNRLVHAADGLFRIWFTTEAIDYWPVFNSTFWLQWRLWGLQPAGYHVVNLLLHATTCLLIWKIGRKLSFPGAFFAALLFALHPVNVESVAWISQCKGLLALVFVLLSIDRFVAAESDASQLSYGLSLGAFLLAMLSKGSVAVLPIVLLGIVVSTRPLTKRDLLRLLPFLLIAVSLVTVNLWFQRHGGQVEFRSAGMIERILGAAAAVWFYLSKALLPLELTFIYPAWHIDSRDPSWWLPLILAVAVTSLLWWSRQGRGRAIWLAWIYFVVALAPVLGFTDVAFMEHSLVADHYQHLALIGVTVLLATGLVQLRNHLAASRRALADLSAWLIVVVLGVLTARQGRLYADAKTLYEDTLRKNPESALAHGNLGAFFNQVGQVPQAIEHLQLALRYKPDFPDAQSNLCNALRDDKRLTEALVHCELAVQQRPEFPGAHNNLGNVLRELGRLPEAIEHYRRALEQNPDFASVHNNLGTALAQSGRLKEGIFHLQRAVQLAPDFEDAQYNLKTALALQRQADDAGRAADLPETR